MDPPGGVTHISRENFKDIPEVEEHARRGLSTYHLYRAEQAAEVRDKKREGSWKDWFRWL